jgi:ABC-type phosphate transport system permease subunit
MTFSPVLIRVFTIAGALLLPLTLSFLSGLPSVVFYIFVLTILLEVFWVSPFSIYFFTILGDVNEPSLVLVSGVTDDRSILVLTIFPLEILPP